MAYMGNLKKGDRVRVTIEADVRFGSSFGVDLGVAGGTVHLREEVWPGVEFEKIEPPVEVFKPGDVVRDKGDHGSMFLILKANRWAALGSGIVHDSEWDDEPWDSRHFEKVNLAES